MGHVGETVTPVLPVRVADNQCRVPENMFRPGTNFLYRKSIGSDDKNRKLMLHVFPGEEIKCHGIRELSPTSLVSQGAKINFKRLKQCHHHCAFVSIRNDVLLSAVDDGT